MGSKWLSLLLALSVLLALSISEVKNSGAHCPPCHENAKCYNTTHCVCKDGFQSKSARPIFSSYEKCEDIDECQTRMAQCKERAYCRNKIGSYICSCVAKYLRILSWVAGFLDIDQPECYKNKNQVTQSSGDIWGNLWQCPGILCIVMIFGVIQWMETRDAAQYSRMNKNYPVTDENLRKNMSKKDFSRNATQILQEIEVDIWNKSLDSPGKGENSHFGIVYDSKRCHQANEKTFLEAGNNTMDIDCTDAFRPMRDRNGVALITYQSLGNILDGSFFHNRRGLQGVQLNSRVVSGTIGLNQMVHLSKPVLLTFQHTQTGAAGMKYFCVYWEGSEEGGSWSMEGCSHVYSNESCTICKCSHLSSFAVLMALTPKEDPVLTLITYVGLSLSLLCLFLAALTFLLCRPIQNTSTSIHLQLSLCLFLAHLLFLTGINRTEPKVLCSVTAGALHYFYLASFIWMLLEGLHLFLTVRNLKVANYTSANRLKKRFMYPAGYGIPAVIVTVSAIVGHKNYGTYTHCWLKPEKGFIWSFMGPVAAIITINLVFYFQVLWILRSKLASLNKEVSTIQDTRVMTFKATAQLFVLGCSWGLGYFMVEEVGNTVGSVIAYSFTIINVLQGLLLFVVHCLLNRQVRMEYKKWFSGMRKGVETESTEMSHSTTHTKVVRPAPLQA